jgi:raffinose/stachyose/melibiose transport system substrate-binding protein
MDPTVGTGGEYGSGKQVSRRMVLRNMAAAGLVLGTGRSALSALDLGSVVKSPQMRYPNTGVGITGWTWQGGEPYVDVLQSDFSLFQKSHAGDTLNLQSVGYTDYFTKFQTAWAGGAPPDFLEMAWSGQYVSLIRAGALQPLDDVLATGFPPFFPNVASTLKFFGHTYGMAMDVNNLTIGYNKKIFAKLGLSVPKTHAELVALSGPLQKAGYQGLAVGLADAWPAGDMWFAQMAYEAPMNQAIPMAEEGKMSWTAAPFVAAAQRAQQLKPLLSSSASALTSTDGITLFAQEKAAMFYPIGNFFTPLVTQQNPNLDYDIFPFPPPSASTPPRATGGAAVIFSAPTKSTKLSVVADYLRTVMSPAGLEILVKDGYFPATPAANISQNSSHLYRRQGSYQATAATRAIFLPKTYAALLSGMQALLGGSGTPQDVVNGMEAAAKSEPSVAQR